MNVIDNILADSIEDGDLIKVVWDEEGSTYVDIVKVSAVFDGGDTIVVEGESLEFGDSTSIGLSPNHPVELLGA